MSARFEGEGTLGRDPELKSVNTKNGTKNIAVMSIKFDVDGPDRGDDKYGFWRTVEFWNEGPAERCAEHLKTGMRVRVEGREVCENWRRDGEDRDRQAYKVWADSVHLSLIGVETVTMQPKKGAQTTERAEGELEDA